MLVSQALLEGNDLELQFLLAKYMFYIAQKQTLALTLEENELRRYFRILRESFVKEGVSSPDDTALLKNINWYLSRKLRKVLEDRPEVIKEIAKDETAGYLKLMDLESNRCGLLVDSLGGFEYIYRQWALVKTNKWWRPQNSHRRNQ